MAMSDYGVIAKKNGKVLNNKIFTPMEDTLGFSVSKDNRGKDIEGNYFIYLGDKDLYIAVYKGLFNVYINKNEFIETILDIDNYKTNDYYTKYRYKTNINGIEFDIKRLYDNHRYYLRFTYKGDLYEVLYGYGVDCNIDYWYDMSKNLKRRLERFVGKK